VIRQIIPGPARASIVATLVIVLIVAITLSGIAAPRLTKTVATKHHIQTEAQACRAVLPTIQATSAQLTQASGELVVSPSKAASDAIGVHAVGPLDGSSNQSSDFREVVDPESGRGRRGRVIHRICQQCNDR
jgi:hypothetical protein